MALLLGCGRAAPELVPEQNAPADDEELALADVKQPAAPPAAPVPATQPEVVDDTPRIYSKRRHVWIHYEPSTSSGWMGFLGLAGSVRLKSTTPVPGNGCEKFYAVEPRGFVCLNGKTTLDPKDSEYAALQPFAPKLGEPFPHHYGESRGMPRYMAIPSPEVQRKREYQLDEHLANVATQREGGFAEGAVPRMLRGVDVTPAGNGPPELLAATPKVQEERDVLKPGSTVAWSEQFDAEGRTWLVTADLALVPKDKVTTYPRSTFGGERLGPDRRLPMVFIRRKPGTKYARSEDGSFVASQDTWPRLARFAVKPEPVRVQGKTYWSTLDGSAWIAEEDAVVVPLSPATPWGTPVEGAQEVQRVALRRVPAPEGGRKTWVDISVLGGWLVAYEDTKPVFATLIAPGRGGVPVRGVDPLDTASTPVGSFRVDGKFWTATMANEYFVHSDVPFAQNFHGPHALHMAYWHDQWGEKMSAGCINLSPIDARWFFLWTEPAIPEGWYGLRSDKLAGPATIVVVHR